MDKKTQIAVIGLGYVGLPLAVHFGAKFHTTGFDLKDSIIKNCKKFEDPTGEVSKNEFERAQYFFPTSDPQKISDADYIIVAVPTPIDKARRPDLKYIESSSETVGKYMKKGVVVIFESTVYPGVTEEVCVPILEKVSGYEWKKDFNVGYSPERINPGDKEHTLSRIIKVVSGDNENTCDKVAELYETIIEAGVHRTLTIKEAEAAKVIENTQRDLNIALMNELALIFDKFGIDTKNVLEAAGSKWNFLPFQPGLVGGHCIGVDPYYLTFKAESEGYHPQIILSGRRINDNMGRFVVEKTIKMMITQGLSIKDSKVGVLGLTFKEDCPDLRNTRVVDIIEELHSYGTNVLVHDAISDPREALEYYNVNLCKWEDLKDLSALIIAVPHKAYVEKSLSEFKDMLLTNGCLIDVKSIFEPEDARKLGINFWRL
ncbi:MAG: nucleotide sugar dehydrogenase [Desulfobacula sp.]|jgi:UDP-N-acetyl-D-galactosamine dehydrogenase|uniref:nucleotide sugar dehydrogenase n=1 Tax=Desulfobacula sp. TaxID=2593537 RepID=UPI001DB0342D|nr:nucleotide sugar dehydrogenase [Desulfobacula sp.]MBT3485445.1 nucleotide sugar dehydrogenase [Desulfobacula sp.]MBT3805588.1 nucleotide sugar dehydrogenase [Desulfobacula sp.]MBT4026084.1 nucleotide sugar dehydrogenase [Desulfobacula sp.]MBT4199968.1 nucleotide sugar dehydrogenase [Desulfobacula sp.]